VIIATRGLAPVIRAVRPAGSLCRIGGIEVGRVRFSPGPARRHDQGRCGVALRVLSRRGGQPSAVDEKSLVNG
jgi:hypothetical protein